MTTTSSHPATPRPADLQAAPLLRIENLRITFAGCALPAVDEVCLSVHCGQTLAVVGESGCGKTVTAYSVLRLLDERAAEVEGVINWRGENLLTCTDRQMRRVRGGQIAMIFQEPMTSLNPVYSIGDQIVEAAMLHRNVSARQAAELSEQAMNDVGIDHPARRMNQYPHEFSGCASGR
jgi:ABC-type microcin C transport system duplicated ATPase subunit YejF